MAIDTVSKRSSAIGVGLPWRNQLPIPDGAINGADRAQSANYYSGLIVIGSGGTSGTARTLTLPIGYWDRDLEHVADKPERPQTRKHAGEGRIPVISGAGSFQSVFKLITIRHKGGGLLPVLLGDGSYALNVNPLTREYASPGGLLATTIESDAGIRAYNGTGNGKSRKRMRREVLELIDADLALLLK